tara:strand:- start:894 stop:1184 length:291 start_codon:yes stop_codon:yes gene_type:complete
MKGDTPINLTNISEWSDDDVEAHLHNIRERRMRPVKVYEEMSMLQAAAKREGLEEILKKQLEMFVKESERADKAINNLEKRSTRLRALRLELDIML